MATGKAFGGKSLLLTGGTGFIGRFLVPELTLAGWNVVVLSRQSPEVVAGILGRSVRSIRDLNHWPEAGGPDACINLAGAGILDKRWSDARKQILRESRIGFTGRLVEWLNSRPQPPQVFLSGSAVGFYGPRRGDECLGEEQSAGQDFAAQLCADWEQAARDISEQSRLCLLRTGVVLHPRFGALAKMLPPFRVGLGGRVGNGLQVMPWIHIADMVGAILHLLHNQQSRGAFNLVAPEAVTNQEFVRGLGSVLHRPVVMPMPGMVLKWLLGEGAMLLLEGQKPVPEALLNQGFQFSFPALGGALQDLL